jgi:geranylgeranyl diphosphate synthase type II
LDLTSYQKEFQQYLDKKKWIREPKNLYEPIDYIIQLSGKRIRPILTLMAADILSGNYKKAFPAALAVEVFHNFTLVHDDIMDDAPLRRGKKTVHEKWDLNRGILSGDAMLILAYQYFENYTPEIFRRLAILFSKTASVNTSGLKGYYAEMQFKNDSSNYAELFLVGSEIFESSK